jgi:hypothetical protein
MPELDSKHRPCQGYQWYDKFRSMASIMCLTAAMPNCGMSAVVLEYRFAWVRPCQAVTPLYSLIICVGPAHCNHSWTHGSQGPDTSPPQLINRQLVNKRVLGTRPLHVCNPPPAGKYQSQLVNRRDRGRPPMRAIHLSHCFSRASRCTDVLYTKTSNAHKACKQVLHK